MKTFATALKRTAVIAIALAALSGCESTDSGGTVSAGGYYDSGFSDPWYYGRYYDDPYMIVSPPPGRPEAPLRPTHPIATPMPSIPSTPRPSFHR